MCISSPVVRVVTLAGTCALVLASGAAGVAAGCEAGEGPIPAERLDAEIGGAYCAWLERCPRADPDLNRMRFVLETSRTYSCADAFAALGLGYGPGLGVRLADGRLRYDPAAARDCVSALGASCYPPLSALDLYPACRAMLQGTRTIGQSCTWDEECSGDSYCDSTGGSACGVCSGRRALGESCTWDVECRRDGLAWGSVCDGSTPICAALRVTDNVADGNPCGFRSDPEGASLSYCAAGHYCSADFTCAPRLALGAACVDGYEPCAGVAECRFSAGASTCRPVVMRTRPLESCDPSIGVDCNPLDRIQCATGGCILETEGTVRSPCFPGELTVACDPGLYCLDRQCTPQKLDGDPCAVDQECLSATCAGGRCGAGACTP